MFQEPSFDVESRDWKRDAPTAPCKMTLKPFEKKGNYKWPVAAICGSLLAAWFLKTVAEAWAQLARKTRGYALQRSNVTSLLRRADVPKMSTKI